MKYRSYNSEIIIATSLIVNVFNDIIIDRRKQGLKRDFSKPISFDDVIQQKIEIPCILGDRSAILKSLENEPGRYKLPLIILQNKSLKTDTNRMADLHADVFYQKDSSFNTLDVTNHLYRPYDLSKKRGQPVIIDYDMTIVTKYKEDMDQILSNWIVHFRPDIYFKWWHPKMKYEPLTSQLTWNHNVGFDSPTEYNPQNVFTYKATTSFLFKTWLFYGMESSFIDDTGEGIIKSFKLFPNKSDKYNSDEDPSKPRVDNTDELDAYVFGDIKETNDGAFSFWTVNNDQEFININDDTEGLLKGRYVVNNVFSENDKNLSGDFDFINYKHNNNNGDILLNNEILNINLKEKHFTFIDNDSNIYSEGQSLIKNVYFKGGFDEKSSKISPPSGDFLFEKFYKSYIDNEKAKLKFGDNYIEFAKVKVSYNIKTKDLIILSDNELMSFKYSMKNILNSEKGIVHEFLLSSKKYQNKKIELFIHKEYDKNFIENISRSKILTKNINILNGKYGLNNLLFFIGDYLEVNKRNNIINCIKSFWPSINLSKLSNTKYYIEIQNTKYSDYIKQKALENDLFRNLNLVCSIFENNYYYKVLMNNYMYIVIKVDSINESKIELYDIGKFLPLTFKSSHGLLYEITIPESKMLLGLNIYMKY